METIYQYDFQYCPECGTKLEYRLERYILNRMVSYCPVCEARERSKSINTAMLENPMQSVNTEMLDSSMYSTGTVVSK